MTFLNFGDDHHVPPTKIYLNALNVMMMTDFVQDRIPATVTKETHEEYTDVYFQIQLENINKMSKRQQATNCQFDCYRIECFAVLVGCLCLSPSCV